MALRVTPQEEVKLDPHKTMLACQWIGKEDMQVGTVPKPMITDPEDVIVHVTTTTICGSDLHMYYNEVSGMHKGDVMGHEFMGIVEEVGSAVKKIKKGDRVVVSAVIACGECYFCKKQLYSCCETTNPSAEMDKMYGDRTAGIFGYTHLTGGFSGGQAEYARVPFGDVTCLPVPDELPDEKVLLLSDVICTGYQATMVMGQMQPDDVVAVWGCGPIGLMAMAWAKFHGASRIIAIDRDPFRLSLARDKLGAETIDFSEVDVVDTLKKWVPRGPDVCIDAAGFRFAKSWTHKLQRTIKLEQDTVDILDECIKSVRKGGHVSMIADYFTITNQFPTGAVQLKAIDIAGGQVHVPRYWHTLLEYIKSGEFDPTFLITHRMHFERISDAYKMFANHENNCVKVLLHTPFYYDLQNQK